jgi:hypothetical protein
LTILIVLAGCSADSSTNSGQVQILSDTSDLKTWLTSVIVDFRNSDQTKVSDKQLRSVLTDDYYNYKSTDISLEYDTITREQFHEKWKTKFHTQYAGNKGFFNWCQDCGPVEITTCRTLKTVGDTARIFHVVIRDVRWNTNSEMEVTVISKDNRPLISDVRHYD